MTKLCNKHISWVPARAFVGLMAAILCLAWQEHAVAQTQGGFIESDVTTRVTTPLLTPSQIASFMPSRGAFTFPAPYNTQGVRITNASDCGGQDCVDMIYSYWRNMSNSANSNTMYIFVGLDRSRGGQGPTLFKFDKTTSQLTDLGPLFNSSSPYSWDSAEGWFFSYSMPTKLYIPHGSQMLRYDVLSHTMETIFDTTTQYPNTVIRQAYVSNNDDVFSATLEDASTYQPLGCVVYKASTNQFHFFPQMAAFNECQIDKSGRYLLILEQTPQICSGCDLDSVVEDLETGKQQILLNQSGGGGHYALGYGKMLMADNWNLFPNAWRLWDFSNNLVSGVPLGVANLLQGSLLYHDWNWTVFEPSHVSFENAVPDTPIDQQYACGSAANSENSPHANDVICFMLNGSGRTLVVAPVMTNVNASGGDATCSTCEGYAKDPKGNIDPTGQYFFWVSNLGGTRMDAFMVKIPAQRLVDTESKTRPPAVTLTSPQDKTTVSGTITITGSMGSNSSGDPAVDTEFILDGSKPLRTFSQPPYTMSWDTSQIGPGTHTLNTVTIDSDGYSTTSKPVTIAVAPSSGSSGGGGSTSAIRITSPQNGASVSGVITVSAQVTDETAVASVTFALDNGSGPSATLTQPPYSLSWNTSDVNAGTHLLTATVTDLNGNTTMSTPVKIHVAAVSPGPPGGGGSRPPGMQHGGSRGGGSLGILALLVVILAYCVRIGVPVRSSKC